MGSFSSWLPYKQKQHQRVGEEESWVEETSIRNRLAERGNNFWDYVVSANAKWNILHDKLKLLSLSPSFPWHCAKETEKRKDQL